MKKHLRNHLLQILVLSGVMLAIGLTSWPFLPSSLDLVITTNTTWTVPTLMTLLIFPGLIFVGGLTFEILLASDPRRPHLIDGNEAYHKLILIMLTFISLLEILFIMEGFGLVLPLIKILTLMGGFTVILIGNELTRLKPNYVIGIRTPWTLANDKVWIKTHRFSGYLYLYGGLLLLLTTVPSQGIEPLASLVIGSLLVVVPPFYSYVTFQRQAKIPPKEPQE